MPKKTIQLTASDGHKLSAYRSDTNAVTKGVLVLLHEIFGITQQMCDLADQYAELGYTVVVPALFDRISIDSVFPYSEAKSALIMVEKCKEETLLMDIQAAINVSDAINCKVSVIGFCWGGGLAYLASCELKLYSAIAFYGTRLLSYLPRTPLCKFQFHFGAEDSHITSEVIETMQRANENNMFYVYQGVGHAFINHCKSSFDLQASELAKLRVIEFITS